MGTLWFGHTELPSPQAQLGVETVTRRVGFEGEVVFLLRHSTLCPLLGIIIIVIAPALPILWPQAPPRGGAALGTSGPRGAP